MCFHVYCIGQFETSMKAANAIKATLPIHILQNAFMAQYFEALYSNDIHILVRFGRWEDILQLDIPTDYKVIL